MSMRAIASAAFDRAYPQKEVLVAAAKKLQEDIKRAMSGEEIEKQPTAVK